MPYVGRGKPFSREVVEAWKAGLDTVAVSARCVIRLAGLADAASEAAGTDDILISDHVRRVLFALA